MIKIKSVILMLGFISISAVTASEVYFVDAHSQFDEKVVLKIGTNPVVYDYETIKMRMVDNNVKNIVISTRGARSPNAAAPNPAYEPYFSECVTPAVRSKNWRYNKDGNYLEFEPWFNAQVNSGNFSALAEALIYHASKKDGEIPAIIIPDFDTDDRVQLVINTGVTYGWPVILHFEFGSIPPNEKQIYRDKLEAVLDAHPNHPFVLIHMAQMGIGDVMRLILRHDNVYFLTSHSDPVSIAASEQPWTNLFKGDVLAPQWRNAFIHFPDRFIFAIDTVFEHHWSAEVYDAKMEYWRSAVADLPSEVAHKFAHGNAERLWGINVPDVNPICGLY